MKLLNVKMIKNDKIHTAQDHFNHTYLCVFQWFLPPQLFILCPVTSLHLMLSDARHKVRSCHCCLVHEWRVTWCRVLHSACWWVTLKSSCYSCCLTSLRIFMFKLSEWTNQMYVGYRTSNLIISRQICFVSDWFCISSMMWQHVEKSKIFVFGQLYYRS